MKLPFALKNNRIVTVDEVERGKKCNSKCPSCGSLLIARHGTKTIHHFAHYNSIECEHAVETSLHLMAKEILDEEKKIMLPPVRFKTNKHHPITFEIFPKQILKFDEIYLEKKLNTIIPDIIIKKNDKILLVEIAVTHFIDNNKKQKIKEFGYSTLEINLSNFKNDFTKSTLRKILIEDIENKKWIYNTRINDYYNYIKQHAVEIETSYGVVQLYAYDCPINAFENKYKGRYCGRVIDYCCRCNYSFIKNTESIYCTGKSKKQIDKLIEKYGKKYENKKVNINDPLNNESQKQT